ncbi:uncharacterized protein LOC126326060 isoform X2 [Schistocerca gregaria]|uniref:uncharacterized protein LOC126326060 isoform X2 n=1 Tax=Schistocerca gregaria TaxID=7010 RepID=UPI00211DBC29|nr:uncharacterized protein LOC126326060 isoform X2 [Schistocerca gregaria]
MRFGRRVPCVLPYVLLLVILCYASKLSYADPGTKTDDGQQVELEIGNIYDNISYRPYKDETLKNEKEDVTASEEKDDIDYVIGLARDRSAEYLDSIGINRAITDRTPFSVDFWYREEYQVKYGGKHDNWAMSGSNSNGRKILKTANRCPSGNLGDIGGNGCKAVSISERTNYSHDVFLTDKGILSFYITEPIDPREALLNVNGKVKLEGKIMVEFSYDYSIQSLGRKSTIRLISSTSGIEVNTDDLNVEYTWDVCQSIDITKIPVSESGGENVFDCELRVDSSLCAYSWVFIVIFAILLVLSIGMLCLAYYRDPDGTGIILLKKRHHESDNRTQMSQYEDDM